MLSNFVEESCQSDSGSVLLAGALHGSISFGLSFANGDDVAYSIIADNGRRVLCTGVYSSGGNSLSRTDVWSFNGATVDTNPAANISLGTGTHRIVNTLQAADLEIFIGLAGSIGQPNGIASLDASGIVPVAQLPVMTSVFGQNFVEKTGSASISTTSTSYQDAIATTVNVTAGEKYRMGMSGLWRSNAWNKSPKIKMLAGAVQSVETVNQAYNSAYTYVRNSFGDTLYFTAAATGSITLKIQYCCYTSGSVVYLHTPKIEFWRVA